MQRRYKSTWRLPVQYLGTYWTVRAIQLTDVPSALTQRVQRRQEHRRAAVLLYFRTGITIDRHYASLGTRNLTQSHPDPQTPPSPLTLLERAPSQ